MPDTTNSLFNVSAEDAGARVDVFLAGKLPGYSRSSIQKLIDLKNVAVNGKPVKKRDMVHAADRVEICGLESPENRARVISENIKLEILWEDEYLIVVNKPAGLVVHPGHGNFTGTLVNALMFHRPGELAAGFEENRPGIVHRLDKETSGVLLVAKTDGAHAALAKLFSERTIDKQYIGICVGRIPLDHGTIEAPLGPSRREPKKRAVSSTGKTALTEYWLLKHQQGISAIRFKLHTGRTHQIRVHTMHAGFPILHDNLYGGGESAMMKMGPLDRPFAWKVFKCFARQALHAQKIGFVHPFTKKKIAVTAPLPGDFLAAVEKMGVTERTFD